MSKKIMNLAEVAEYLGRSTKTIVSWEEQEESFPRSKTIGGSRMYNTAEIEAYINFSQTKVVTGDTKELDALGRELVKRAIKEGSDRQVLFKAITPEMLRDELHVIFNMMYLRRGRDGGNIDKQYLAIRLSRSPEFINDNPNIDLSIFKDSESDVNIAFMNSVFKLYDELIEEKNTDDTLQLVIDKYLEEYRFLRVAALLDDASEIFRTGKKSGRKQMIGASDTMDYLKTGFNKLENDLAQDMGQGLMLSTEVGMIDSERTKSVKIGDFGDLEFLTDLYGGVRTGLFYSFLAPPKSGKSKFTYRLAYISMTQYKQSVVYWPREGGPEKLMAELRAIHFSEYYKNRGIINTDISVDAETILRDTFPSPEVKDLEAVSRADLFASGKYGVLGIIDVPLALETFEDEIREAVKATGATSVYVDYLALIESQNSRSSKSEVIGRAYQRALTLCKDINVAFISPGQFKQEFIKSMAQGEEVDARIAGGESSEVVRTPDVNIALYATPERLLENEMDLLSIPSRVAEPFPRTTIYADLGKNYFSEVKDGDISYSETSVDM